VYEVPYGSGEGGRHLVGELALLPQPSRLVHEPLQLRRHVAEPHGRAEADAVRPLQVLEARVRLVLDVADAHLSPLASCSKASRRIEVASR
jgi:hypothetical protein